MKVDDNVDPFHGKTMRLNCQEIHRAAKLIRHYEQSTDAPVELPATEMDTWIAGDKFKTSTNCNFFWKDIVIPKEKLQDQNEVECEGDEEEACTSQQEEKKWNVLRRTLTEKAVAVRTEYLQRENRTVEHFEIPIIGHYFVPSNPQDSRFVSHDTRRGPSFPSNWLLWKGKYYSPEFIYRAVTKSNNEMYFNCEDVTELIPVCHTLATEAVQTVEAKPRDYVPDDESKDQFDALDRWTQTVDPVLCRGAMLHRSRASRKTKKPTTTTASYLEFDLHRECDITALSIMGAQPKQLNNFPQRNRNAHDKYINHPTVSVLRQHCSLSWVRSFAISIRDMHTGQWRAVNTPSGVSSSSFVGNEDVGTQVIHRFASGSLIARHIRIIPLEFVGDKPMMRVALFGKRIEEKIHNQQHVIGSQPVKEVMQTVTFSLYPEMHSKFTAHNKLRGCRCEYCVPAVIFSNRHYRKVQQNASIQEQMASLDLDR